MTLCPYDPIFAAHPAESIPEAFRSQFLRRPGAPFVSVVEGSLDRVWSRPGAIRPFLAVLGRIGIIAPGQGRDVFARLTLRPGIDQRGRAYQVCDRAFVYGSPRPFVTRKVWDPEVGRLIEFCGPTGAFVVDWDAEFRPPDTLAFVSRRMGLQLAGRIAWLPRRASRWLFGTATFTQIALDESSFRIEFLVRHPLLGPVFGYEGPCVLRDEPA